MVDAPAAESPTLASQTGAAADFAAKTKAGRMKSGEFMAQLNTSIANAISALGILDMTTSSNPDAKRVLRLGNTYLSYRLLLNENEPARLQWTIKGAVQMLVEQRIDDVATASAVDSLPNDGGDLTWTHL